jgi:hypothetical protein
MSHPVVFSYNIDVKERVQLYFYSVCIFVAGYRVNFTFTFLNVFANMQKVTVTFVVSVCLSVHTEQLGCHGRIFMKFDIWVLF